MSIGRITFSKNGKQTNLELWGNRAGTREEIRKSGAALLAELRATSKKAAVWIDGKRLKIASEGHEEPFTPLNVSEVMPVHRGPCEPQETKEGEAQAVGEGERTKLGQAPTYKTGASA